MRNHSQKIVVPERRRPRMMVMLTLRLLRERTLPCVSAAIANSPEILTSICGQYPFVGGFRTLAQSLRRVQVERAADLVVSSPALTGRQVRLLGPEELGDVLVVMLEGDERRSETLITRSMTVP